MMTLTGSSSSGSDGKKDSTFGKLLEKAGEVLNEDRLKEKGQDKREAAGYGERD